MMTAIQSYLTEKWTTQHIRDGYIQMSTQKRNIYLAMISKSASQI